MATTIAVTGCAGCIGAAEKRVAAMEALCSILVSQVRRERQHLEFLKSGLMAVPVRDNGEFAAGAPVDEALAMLDG